MKAIVRADSTEFLKQIKNNTFELVLTDPPYHYVLEQKLSIHYDLRRISRGTTIVFSPPENQWILPADQYLFWVKPISTKNTSRNYSRFVEMIFVYQNSGSKWNNNRHWSQYTNMFTDLVDYRHLHPHRKPVALIERLILNHTDPGDRVLDPFCGSGVVAQACERLGRNYLCCDIDETNVVMARKLVERTRNPGTH